MIPGLSPNAILMSVDSVLLWCILAQTRLQAANVAYSAYGLRVMSSSSTTDNNHSEVKTKSLRHLQKGKVLSDVRPCLVSANLKLSMKKVLTGGCYEFVGSPFLRACRFSANSALNLCAFNVLGFDIVTLSLTQNHKNPDRLNNKHYSLTRKAYKIFVVTLIRIYHKSA